MKHFLQRFEFVYNFVSMDCNFSLKKGCFKLMDREQ